MTPREFITTYNANSGMVYQLIKKGILSNPIDMKQLEALIDKQVDIVQFNQDMYHWLSEFYDDIIIAKDLAHGSKYREQSIKNYMDRELFAVREKSITSLTVPDMELYVYERFKELESKMRKLVPNWSVEYILDRRMESVA